MKRVLNAVLGGCLLVASCAAPKKDTITIKGKVQFPDNQFNMEIVERNGFDKTIIDSCKVNADGTYQFTMKVDRPGVYTLECQKWQSVQFWAEDEDLEINFRGMDTARIKIKNPPYVHINGGPNNEVMNLLNWDSYRGYQLMIGVSQGVYRIEGLDMQAKQETSMKFYDMLGDESRARSKYIAEHYADRNSVLAVLPMLRGNENAALVEQVLAKLEAKNPDYAPLKKYKADMAEAKAQKERLAEGKVAPEFSYPTQDGNKNLGPQDFKGKILVLDFWASWCGPCRAEIPHLKEAYNEKGVEFLSVSIDKDGNAWRKAMKDENMPWAQVQAPKAGKDVMKLYQFSGIPYILVLDQEGRIVGKNLRGQKLMDKLEEMVNGGAKKSVAMLVAGILFGAEAQNRSINFEQTKVWKQIVKKAKKEKKLIFVDCYTSWCGPCKMLANNVFTKDEVADYFNQTFVNAKYDMEKDEDGIILKTQFGVKAFPTLVFVDPATQQVVHRMVGAGSAEWLVEGAKTAGDPQNNLTGLTKRYEAGERNGECQCHCRPHNTIV